MQSATRVAATGLTQHALAEGAPHACTSGTSAESDDEWMSQNEAEAFWQTAASLRAVCR